MSTPSSIRDGLEAARQELLDLGLRNPLLNYRTLRARGLDVVDEAPAEVYRVLVTDGRPMGFLPAPEPVVGTTPAAPVAEAAPPADPLLVEEGAAPLPPPEEETLPNGKTRLTDTRLQTPYPAAVLQERLLSTFYAARTVVAEQGVNVLHLALGMLEWTEDDASEKVHRAPLVLVPVELTRTDVRARFRLQPTGEDVGGNLSLQARLKAGFGLTLPLPDPEADLDVGAYFAAVADAVDGMPRWRVDADAVHLGFFLFGKLLMYNDLDPAVWPLGAGPAEHEVLRALLGDGFAPATGRLPEDEPLDRHLHPEHVRQVVDADGSQSLALLDVAHGNHLVVQGPPGTGKSQTITNLIAEAIGQGKTVLFVAEKMAALEVVKRRLDAVHLGDACLELHSHKTTKRALLDELQRTLGLGEPRSAALDSTPDALLDARDRLNAYAEAVNAPIGQTGVSPYEAYGRLLALRETLPDGPLPVGPDAAMEGWTPAGYDRRRARVARAQALVAEIGRPADHPFWGSRRTAYLPTENAAIESAARDAAAVVSTLAGHARTLGDVFGLAAATPADAALLVRTVARALTAPDLSGVAVNDPGWAGERDEIEELLATGERLAALHREYDATVIPEAWSAPLLETRGHLAAHGEKWYRGLIGDWRRAKAHLAGLLTGPLPDEGVARVALADALMEAQRLQAELDRQNAAATDRFGPAWRGAASDWTALRVLAAWLGALHEETGTGAAPGALLAYLTAHPDPAPLRPLHTAADGALRDFVVRMEAAIETVAFVAERRWGTGARLTDQPFERLRALAIGWATHVPLLQGIVAFNHETAALTEDDLLLFADAAAHWENAGRHLTDLFDHVWFTTLLDRAFLDRAALAGFNGALHAEALRRFSDRDSHALVASRARLALEHWQALPRHGTAGAASGGLGMLRHEFSKKRRHLPIRTLMERAGRAIQAVKPVFMMSPMSVAAYLPPGAVEFDLVVFDEASQVRPVDAFGALLRGRQAVVVGDSRQLPPTRFFDAVMGEGEGEGYDEEGSATADVESVLELFKAKQAPERMLRWHYRSRHESLIAVSNREFYEGRLVTFPSPDAARAEVGLAYHHLPDAFYDRGGRRTNPAEARAVAEAVMAHAHAHPELTLLVATFSQAQQREVQDQVERLRRADPSTEAFFSPDRLEPFDVKNLENVQGDERDVVFISVGYGRTEGGAVSMNFGPLNQDGGERRLNVLISRARRRCEVFTNLRADDLDLSRTEARGVASFKRYLHYAETGVLEAALAGGRTPAAPFEEAVAAALVAAGYEVVPQVGVGGFRVDLAVVDPDKPGRYLLGVVCDGATYHSARTARDRDRIRQTVLEGLGWRLHRVWSTDWFRDPARERERVVAAVAQARAAPAGAPLPPTAVAEPLHRGPAPPPPPDGPSTTPYVLATLRRHAGELPEVPLRRLAGDVLTVVRVEGPVHVDEVARRLLDAAGAARMGSRIREALDGALALAAADPEVERRGDFLHLRAQRRADVPVRDRSALPAASRAVDLIAGIEWEAAVVAAVTDAFGIAAGDLPPEVARRLGFAQTTEALRVSVEGALADLQAAGIVGERGGLLTLTSLDSADDEALL
ncbi:MAG TPA: DUF3320 domain-containing protein [Rhodothermales bacterium]|nr:DUF3320 domain-containing protein [Rhodothermales bacterium]